MLQFILKGSQNRNSDKKLRQAPQRMLFMGLLPCLLNFLLLFDFWDYNLIMTFLPPNPPTFPLYPSNPWPLSSLSVIVCVYILLYAYMYTKYNLFSLYNVISMYAFRADSLLSYTISDRLPRSGAAYCWAGPPITIINQEKSCLEAKLMEAIPRLRFPLCWWLWLVSSWH